MKKTLLVVNVYYSPRSFGGATIVAEEVNKILKKDFEWNIVVLTSTKDNTLTDFHITRYKAKDVDVISLNLPQNQTYEDVYKNYHAADEIREILKFIQPDIIHSHATQNIGTAYAKVINELNIPHVTTLHDCWFICERQFMINNHGKYCFQRKIDAAVCSHCINDPYKNSIRTEYFSDIIKAYDAILYPSKFHLDLHIENDFPKQKSFVNKNGIKPPKPNYKKSFSSKTRFGFVGGPGYIKGATVIKDAVKQIENNNFELRVVDAGKKIGHSWKQDFDDWEISGQLKIIPPYNQDTLDEFFSEIDVLLFPSQWKESFGLTVREALIRDVWVIATNGGGTVEDLVENKNATIIPITDDPTFLVNAMEEAMKVDWNKYFNEYKGEIRTYFDQAKELNETYNNLLTS